MLSAAKKPEESSVYEMYYEFEEPIKKLAGHRVLALNRGEKEKILTVKGRMHRKKKSLGWLQKQVHYKRKSNYNTGSSRSSGRQLQASDRTGD